MSRTHSPRIVLNWLVRRAAARQAAVTAGLVAVPFRRSTAALAAALALTAAPAPAQGPTPRGGEFRVSTFTTEAQVGPSVAVDADGDFVVAWYSLGQDGDNFGVYAQRYAANGAAVGPEFRVNATTTGSQAGPSVAMDADGDFVVAWDSGGQDGASAGVYAQRYAASGAAVEPEFRVNTFTTGHQANPSVAMDPDGDFVIAWNSGPGYGPEVVGQDGDNSGVYAQRYAASGAPVGGEFMVNTFTTGSQAGPSVAVDADGDFVVAWSSSEQDGASTGVYAQQYAATGAPVGPEFRVNTFTAGPQVSPSVAMDADGDFVVAWETRAESDSEDGPEYGPQRAGQDGSESGVYAQRYAASGAAVGPEFQVNTTTRKYQLNPSVAVDAAGDFVVAWESTVQDQEAGRWGTNVYAQRYAASGAAVGGEFRVNTFTTEDQAHPSVALDTDGDFVVAWDSRGQDGDNRGVYAQRYSRVGVANETGAPDTFALTLDPSLVGPAGSTVRYDLPESAAVRLSVTNVLGHEVAVLVEGAQSAGVHEARLDASLLDPGVYVVRLEASGTSTVRQVTVKR